jgi:hypothetical protein
MSYHVGLFLTILNWAEQFRFLLNPFSLGAIQSYYCLKVAFSRIGAIFHDFEKDSTFLNNIPRFFSSIFIKKAQSYNHQKVYFPLLGMFGAERSIMLRKGTLCFKTEHKGTKRHEWERNVMKRQGTALFCQLLRSIPLFSIKIKRPKSLLSLFGQFVPI